MTDADRRTKAIEAINGHLASIETARVRVNKAKSELGTAQRGLRDAVAEYARAKSTLERLLPDVSASAAAAFDVERGDSEAQAS